MDNLKNKTNKAESSWEKWKNRAWQWCPMSRLAKKPVLPLNTSIISIKKPSVFSLFLFERSLVKSSIYCNLKSLN